ncbi:MAG: cytochrome c [Alphaproteobacteria bacterium]|nr:cytochrome c [Alphaproteobacteria bacterium]
MRLWLLLVLAALVGVLALVVTWRAAGEGADPGDPRQVARGQALYAAHCASCHGKALEGQPNWREPLAAGGYPAPPHDASGHTWHHADQLLFDYTKAGGQALAPAGFKSTMPAFAGAIGDTDIWAVIAYIKSTWPASILARQQAIDRAARARGR